MEVVYPCCCGLDVHKKSITACVLWAEVKGKSRKEKKRFGTFTHDLLQLADWLEQCGVTHVAMESTGVYWKPVWNILAERFEVLLVYGHPSVARELLCFCVAVVANLPKAVLSRFMKGGRYLRFQSMVSFNNE
jgi:hypothetical protein